MTNIETRPLRAVPLQRLVRLLLAWIFLGWWAVPSALIFIIFPMWLIEPDCAANIWKDGKRWFFSIREPNDKLTHGATP